MGRVRNGKREERTPEQEADLQEAKRLATLDVQRRERRESLRKQALEALIMGDDVTLQNVRSELRDIQ